MIHPEPRGHLSVASQVPGSSEGHKAWRGRERWKQKRCMKDMNEKKDGGSPGENSENPKNQTRTDDQRVLVCPGGVACLMQVWGMTP